MTMVQGPSSHLQNDVAVLLDRDGTIIVDKHYLSEPDGVEFETGAVAGLRHLTSLGLRLAVVTNQSGIGRNILTYSQAKAVNARLSDMLRQEGITIEGWYICPHGPETHCACRKPQPGLALRAQRDLLIKLNRSYVIGDKLSDIELARQVGAEGILVRTGSGESGVDEALKRGFIVVDNLEEAATVIGCAISESQISDRQAVEDFQSDYLRLKQWLFQNALPLWSTVGTDTSNSGFFESIDDHSMPVEAPRRTRVIARQLFCFAAAGRMGWNGEVAQLVDHGLDALYDRCLTVDGLVVKTYDAAGATADATFDLYDHAFALFALAQVARIANYRERALAVATKMMAAIQARVKHPIAGFNEHPDGRLPLRANPHMHLLEACLAFGKVSNVGAIWRKAADEIVALAISKFINPDTGALHEFFDANWNFALGEPGRLVEPGHQFEWAWLLLIWNENVGRADVDEAANRLVAIGELGMSPTSAGVIDELWDDLSPRSTALRCWPQTERLKAWLAIAERAQTGVLRADAYQRASHSIRSIERFTVGALPSGSWIDRLNPDLSPVAGAAPASTLYHIVCGLETAREVLERMKGENSVTQIESPDK